jgi:hypothetical protein
MLHQFSNYFPIPGEDFPRAGLESIAQILGGRLFDTSPVFQRWVGERRSRIGFQALRDQGRVAGFKVLQAFRGQTDEVLLPRGLAGLVDRESQRRQVGRPGLWIACGDERKVA